MKTRFAAAGAALLALSIVACGQRETESQADPALEETGALADTVDAIETGMEAATGDAEKPADRAARTTGDKFTYANYDEVRVAHVALDLDILFDEKVLDGSAILDLDYVDPAARRLVLDTNDLLIKSVEARTGGEWSPATIDLGPDDPVLGARLEIALPVGADKVRIAYRTDPGAGGLQWLTPEQTAGKAHPFVYSQAQAIYARSMAPLQDTPAVRMTYEARLRTPADLVAVMSAEQDPDGVRDGDYTFKMPQPIPSYLLAIAAGDIEFKAINDHVGVYAEEYILDAAAKEFEDTPQMEVATAALYGPYRWGRYDMIVLPPSFPYGGMENPRLSFLTPTLVAGDKSLTNVVAHELAHSWSGNLVTNATWRDAWLNEGFTSYVENRVMEALYGEERATMERALDLEKLKRDVSESERPELTQLKLPADLKHPDEAFTQVAYVKGAFFLKFLEQRFGRDAFDPFLKDYFDHFAFQSIVTEDFVDYLKENLIAKAPDAVTQAELTEWVYGPGIPDTIEHPVSDAFDKVAATQEAWLSGALAVSDIDTAAWTTHEWLHFLNSLPDDISTTQLAELDQQFELSTSENAEIAYAWYMQAIRAGYEPAMAPLEDFLMRVGRGKFIYRLYGALAEHGQKVRAIEIFEAARAGYHPIAQRRIAETLGL